MVDASEILLKLEQNFDLFNLELRGFRIWWMSRYKVYENIQATLNNRNKENNKSSTDIDLKKYLSNGKYLSSFKWGINNYIQSDILCISGTTLRRKIVDNKYFDIIFDFIGKYDKSNYGILNTLSGNGFEKNHYTLKCYNMCNLTLKNHIIKAIYKIKLNKEEKEYISYKFKKVERYLKNEYNINLDLTRVVCEQTAILFSQYKIALRIIRKINPKVLYVECAYSPTHLLFVYAAKVLKIPVVEFQHGLISSKHIGYKYNESTYKIDPVPDYICVYGSYFETIIRKMNPNLKLNIIRYGYPFLYEELLGKKNNNLIENKEFDYLITTQGEEYSDYWVKFIQGLLEKDKSCKVLLKVHPNEILIYKQLYSKILSSSRVVVSQNENIYDCFKKSKRHISCFSTCHYEALVYDIPTYVIKFPGWQHVRMLEHYNVKCFNSAAEFIDYLKINPDEEILFDQFKKDFFDIESDNINEDKIKEKVVCTNRFFIYK